ncbi:uncharacterized protein [Watersipora subatra]|uniref:uncharacterized protein n=1 Tax=Watersipora subatra TaxID=2589382 RepID=UPI00355B7F15
MSKLAAICAKLKSDAVAVNCNTRDASPTPISSSLSAQEDELPSALEQFTNDSSSAGDPDTSELLPADTAIGVLKRKSIMPPSGASRRKMQRPALATTQNHQAVSALPEDNLSIEGSEHSLHMDLPEDSLKSTPDVGRTSPFQPYGRSPASANPGVLQALGLTGISADTFSGAMASQSLAALAQQEHYSPVSLIPTVSGVFTLTQRQLRTDVSNLISCYRFQEIYNHFLYGS